MADNTTAEQKKAAEAVNEKKEETSPAPTKKEASTDDKSGKAESTSTNSETNNNSPPRVSLPPLTEDGRHRLETAWTFWYDKKDRSKDYEENLQPMGTFDTVEDFFRLYSHIKKPSTLPKDANYHIFRAGYKPMWESFPKGGCFIKKIKKPDGVTDAPLLNRMWEELVFATIGEEFADPEVMGIVLSIRAKEDVLSVWNSDTKNHGLRYKIGEKLKEIWQLDPHTPLEYKNIAAAMKDGSSYRRHVQQIYVP